MFARVNKGVAFANGNALTLLLFPYQVSGAGDPIGRFSPVHPSSRHPRCIHVRLALCHPIG
jgi:hypothetical protein